MGVTVGLVVGVRVDVAVGLAASVGVDVDVVKAAAPPDEKPQCQQHNDAPDGDFGNLADDLGQVLVQENERQAHEYERGPVAQAPEDAHRASLPYLISLLLGGDEGGDSGEMIRVTRVSQTEQQADEQDDPYADLSVQESLEPAVYRAHPLLLVSVFQRGPHQIAVMLPGKVYVVNVFSRDPAYPGHVVCGVWLAVHNTRQKADGEDPDPIRPVGVRRQQDRVLFYLDLDPEFLPHLPLDPSDRMLPDLDETTRHIHPPLLRLSGPNGDESLAVTHDGDPDRGG